MRAKLPWPFLTVIVCSFVLGAAWGWKLLRDRTSEEGRLKAEARLSVLSPPGILSRELLIEFQRREKIEVELTTEPFPSSLLRRALKSAPGQFDLVLVYHHQVSALRAERKLVSLFDSRSKFPTVIAPDFRKLPNDRNLMDTAPLLWGVLGTASAKEFEGLKPRIGFWPAILTGIDDGETAASTFAAKMQPMFAESTELLNQMKKGPGGLSTTPTSPVIVSHASLAFRPYKDLNLTFAPLKANERELHPLWILTAAAIADGDLERARKFVRFLLEPSQTLALIETARVGATTLREQVELASLPKELRASYFRTFSIDKISIERDERVRNADDVLEQMVQGASLKMPSGPLATKLVDGAPATAKVKLKSPPRQAPVEPVNAEAGIPAAAESASSATPGVTSGATSEVPAELPRPEVTAPSELQPRDD